MKRLKFTRRKNDPLGYLFIIPALLFITLFSLIPIIQSLQYSFFDYQLNDQQKNGMYFTTHYNVDLADENVFYIQYYLDSELSNVTEDSTKTLIEATISQINTEYDTLKSSLGATSGIIKINQTERSEIQTFNESTQTKVAAIYGITGETFAIKQDTLDVATGLNTTIIDKNFIGFDNFVTAFKDARMYSTLLTTLIFTFSSVFFELILGIMLALIMNKSIRGKGIIRTTSLIPWAIPTSVAALLWLYMFNGDSGIFAMILTKLHIISSPSVLLGSGLHAFIALVLTDVWKTTPYMALLILAGLQTIPKDLYESSSIDGASIIQQFRKITLPLLKSSILVALLFRTLDAFRVFDLIYVLTKGGPGGQTESISIYSYKVLKSQTVLGYGSTLVIIMAVIVGIISYIYIKVLGVKIASTDN